jgi:hypothetical protein
MDTTETPLTSQFSRPVYLLIQRLTDHLLDQGIPFLLGHEAHLRTHLALNLLNGAGNLTDHKRGREGPSHLEQPDLLKDQYFNGRFQRLFQFFIFWRHKVLLPEKKVFGNC